jgi:hypothetical protein
MQLFVRLHRKMIAAPVQGDIDGIPQRPHSARIPPLLQRRNLFLSPFDQ